MFQYRQVLVRLRRGESDREIARGKYMGRRKLAVLREVAQRAGWLDPVSRIGVIEPGMIGVMEPVRGGETGIPAGSRMRGFRRIRNPRSGCCRRQLRGAVRVAVEYQAVGVVAQPVEGC